jgi:hypothetical protein
MSEREVDEMKKVLQVAIKPASGAELRRDLWPVMLERLSRGTLRVPWWDWVLLAGASLVLWFFPVIVPALLYHL